MDLKQSNKFTIMLTDDESKITQTINKFTLPNVSVGLVERYTRGKTINMVGDSIDEGPITASVLLDDEWENYVYYRNWLKTFPFYKNKKDNPLTGTEALLKGENFKDLKFSVYNNQNKNNISFLFKKCWIQDISDIFLDATLEDDSDVIAFDITIEYREMEIIHE